MPLLLVISFLIGRGKAVWSIFYNPKLIANLTMNDSSIQLDAGGESMIFALACICCAV